MHDVMPFFTTCFPSIFSIVDPLAVIPIYLALVSRETADVQRGIAVRAALTLATVLLTFALSGSLIFHFFGFEVYALKIAGGFLLAVSAVDMVHAKHGSERATEEEQREAENKTAVAVIPLGIPLLSGPGAIATVTVWSAKAKSVSDRLALYSSIVLVALTTWLVLLFAQRLGRFFGKTGINIASRIMGIILAATAAQFVIDGTTDAIAKYQATAAQRLEAPTAPATTASPVASSPAK